VKQDNLTLDPVAFAALDDTHFDHSFSAGENAGFRWTADSSAAGFSRQVGQTRPVSAQMPSHNEPQTRQRRRRETGRFSVISLPLALDAP
jgi:hypothetical protein